MSNYVLRVVISIQLLIKSMFEVNLTVGQRRSFFYLKFKYSVATLVKLFRGRSKGAGGEGVRESVTCTFLLFQTLILKLFEAKSHV